MKRKGCWNTALLLVLGAICSFGALQFLPLGGDRSNPPVVAEPNWDSPRTRGLFMSACGDCHSNETNWPWYSRFAPASWLIARDVNEGRKKFNISRWGQGENEGEEAAHHYQTGEMPLPIYLLMHPEARLNEVDRQALLDGLAATFGGELEGESDD